MFQSDQRIGISISMKIRSNKKARGRIFSLVLSDLHCSQKRVSTGEVQYVQGFSARDSLVKRFVVDCLEMFVSTESSGSLRYF